VTRMEISGPVNTPEQSRYMAVDPATLGRLRVLRIGDVELQLDGHKLLVRGTPVHLPHKEFVILRQLMDNAGRVVTRRELLATPGARIIRPSGTTWRSTFDGLG
jgi:hypothetical protein